MSGSQKFGGVVGLGDGRFRARFVADGQRLSKHFRNEADAYAWLEQQRALLTTNRFEQARQAEKITFRQAAQRFRSERLAKGDTPTQMKKLDAVLKHGGLMLDMPLGSVQHRHVRAYREMRLSMQRELKGRRRDNELPPRTSKPLSVKTINKEISAISVIFKYARADWGLDTLTNPTDDLRLREDNVDDVAQRVQPHLMESLLRGAEEYQQHQYARVHIAAFIELAVITTARLSALARARWDHISPTGKTLEIPRQDSKNKQVYSVGLPQRAREILASLPRSSEFIFGGDASSIATAWNRVKRRAGVQRRLHDLRHEGTSSLFERAHSLGLTDQDIALLTSHRSFAALRRYFHLKSAAVVDKIDRNSRSEMQQFVEDLLIEGDGESLSLAASIARKRRQMQERAAAADGHIIEGEVSKTRLEVGLKGLQ